MTGWRRGNAACDDDSPIGNAPLAAVTYAPGAIIVAPLESFTVVFIALPADGVPGTKPPPGAVIEKAIEPTTGLRVNVPS